jgi:hypothetical protein
VAALLPECGGVFGWPSNVKVAAEERCMLRV